MTEIRKPPASTADLRGFLLEQMIRVSEGLQEPLEAKAICNYAQQVYNTVNLEVRYAQAKSKIGGASISPVSFVAEVDGGA